MSTPRIFQIPDNLIKELNIREIRIWDVRTPMEFIHGHIKGAENIPLDELDWFLKEQFDCCGKAIVTCSTGDQRSARACELLRGRGVEVADGGNWERLKEMISEELAE